MDDVIVTKNLTKDFGSFRGIFNVNINIKKGETVGFLGPNGAGKSTTIRNLMGFEKPDGGEAMILGMDCFLTYNEIMNNVGYLPGEVNFIDGISAKEIIETLFQMKKINDRSYLNNLLEIFPLNLNMNTKKMSVGEKRKLAVIVAFMSNPDILILDEPTSGLDPILQEKFIEFIKQQKSLGKTILLSSHMFNEVEALCDRIIIIKDGNIIKELKHEDITIIKEKKFEITFETKSMRESFENEYKESEKLNDVTTLIKINEENVNCLFNILTKYYVINLYERLFNFEEYFLSFYKNDRTFGGI